MNTLNYLPDTQKTQERAELENSILDKILYYKPLLDMSQVVEMLGNYSDKRLTEVKKNLENIKIPKDEEVKASDYGEGGLEFERRQIAEELQLTGEGMANFIKRLTKYTKYILTLDEITLILSQKNNFTLPANQEVQNAIIRFARKSQNELASGVYGELF